METERCASKDAEPRRGGVDYEISHRLKRGTSANKNAGSRREVDCEISRRLKREMKHFFIKVWKPLSSRCVSKTLEKPKNDNIG